MSMGEDYSHTRRAGKRISPVPPLRLSRAQVREVDRIAIARYGIPGIVLMENAARGASDVALAMLHDPTAMHLSANQAGGAAQRSPGSASAADVLIVCGGGNNGGDGLAIARHLHNSGCQVRLALTIDPDRYEGDALINWRIVRAMNLPQEAFDPARIGTPDLIVDAVFGTGLSKPPRDPFPRLADAINASGAPILAIDLPSGLDCDTGHPLGPACIRATRTVTFVAEKTGFATAGSRAFTGDVVVAEIGCPREIIDEVTRLPPRLDCDPHPPHNPPH
jgi:NAD(P)H-hydrate epimerase